MQTEISSEGCTCLPRERSTAAAYMQGRMNTAALLRHHRIDRMRDRLAAKMDSCDTGRLHHHHTCGFFGIKDQPYLSCSLSLGQTIT